MTWSRLVWLPAALIALVSPTLIAAEPSVDPGIASRQLGVGPKIGAVRAGELRRALRGEEVRTASEQRDAVARAQDHREVAARRLAAGPKLGFLKRGQLRSEIEEIDALIAAVERGESIDVARLDALIGSVQARTNPTQEQRLAALQRERDALDSRLRRHGPKLGLQRRAAYRARIEEIDASLRN